MIVRLFDIVGIVDHHFLNCLFIVNYEAKVQTVMVNISTDINIRNKSLYISYKTTIFQKFILKSIHTRFRSFLYQ